MKASALLALQTATAFQAAVLSVKAADSRSPVKLARAPLALSFEFADAWKWFGTYGQDSTTYDSSFRDKTYSCLLELGNSTSDNEMIHIRVGGRTQDLAKYKNDLKVGMKQHGSKTSKKQKPKETLPKSIFGPRFLSYMPNHAQLTIGLNRARNDLTNPAEAAYQLALHDDGESRIYAFEFGNEPDL